MRVLLLDNVHPVLQKMLESEGIRCDVLYTNDLHEIESIIDQYEGVIVRSKHPVNCSFIDKATRLQWIGRLGAGMETIDVAYAESKGIYCINSPEGNRDAVAEHALGMLLCLFNKIIQADAEVKQGIWHREENRGIELKRKTVGIIGFGNMGSEFAKRLQGFGCRIIAFDKYKKGYAPDYVEEVSMDELFKEADILSLHIPLTDETRYLADNDFFQSFSKNIYVINTARGEILNTEHLVNQLKKGKIAGACLDVLEYENMKNDSLEKKNTPLSLVYLCNSEKVILTPHIAGWSQESKMKLAEVLAQKIIRFKKNQSIQIG